MMNGVELYRLMEQHYSLFDGRAPAGGPACFETFPQAIACSLAGRIVPAKQKRTVRRELLNKAGINTEALTNMDLVDAALCALTAHYVLINRFKAYGDATEGCIVVPNVRPIKR